MCCPVKNSCVPHSWNIELILYNILQLILYIRVEHAITGKFVKVIFAPIALFELFSLVKKRTIVNVHSYNKVKKDQWSYIYWHIITKYNINMRPQPIFLYRKATNHLVRTSQWDRAALNGILMYSRHTSIWDSVGGCVIRPCCPLEMWTKGLRQRSCHTSKTLVARGHYWTPSIPSKVI